MNKFLSEIRNANLPVLNMNTQLMDTKCDGITLYDAMRIGKAVQRVIEATNKLMQLAIEVSENPTTGY